MILDSLRFGQTIVCCRYPYNLDFDSYKALEGLSKFSINNLGDPFIESNYGVHSRPFEVNSAKLSRPLARLLVVRPLKR